MSNIVVIGLIYCAITGYMGYLRGEDAGRMFGAIELSEVTANQAPDWERMSPTFALGVNLGICAVAHCK